MVRSHACRGRPRGRPQSLGGLLIQADRARVWSSIGSERATCPNNTIWHEQLPYASTIIIIIIIYLRTQAVKIASNIIMFPAGFTSLTERREQLARKVFLTLHSTTEIVLTSLTSSSPRFYDFCHA